MYDKVDKSKENDLIHLGKKVLSNADLFKYAIEGVFQNWKISCLHNLTNPNINKKAWLGHAACSYQYSVPEYLTRISWGELSEIEKQEANLIAENKINIWLNKQPSSQLKIIFHEKGINT